MVNKLQSRDDRIAFWCTVTKGNRVFIIFFSTFNTFVELLFKPVSRFNVFSVRIIPIVSPVVVIQINDYIIRCENSLIICGT